VVIGAGAIGGVIAARLATRLPDGSVVLIARSDNAAAIRSGGLHFRAPGEDVRVPVTVAEGPHEVALTTEDVLVFATKTHQVQSALLEWADQPVARPDGSPAGSACDLLPVFMALNGVASERMALRLFRRVFGVCVWLPAVHLAPGEVLLRIAPASGVFIAGRYGTSDDIDDETILSRLRAEWERSGFVVHTVPDVMRWKYAKLIGNLGNAVQALAGPGADSGDVVETLRREGRAVLAAAGIESASHAEEAEWRGDLFQIRHVDGLDGAVGGSSWQSMMRGSGSIESDYLNGEIALLAREHNVEAPANAAVQAASRRAAASRMAAGSMPLEELRRLIG
jgi:2-dehydropantoate 2-reductase